MRIHPGCLTVWLAFTSACSSGSESASDTMAAVDSASCPNPRLKTDGEWPVVESFDATFSETLVSSAGERSFRSLSCGVENSARQPTFAWTAPYSGTFRFSGLVDFAPDRDIALAVLSGDCAGDELSCKASHTLRVGFDLELAEGERVSVLIELDDTFGDEDAELQAAIADIAEL